MNLENAVKRTDIFLVPFTKLKTIEGFNLPDRDKDIVALAESIYQNGVKMPLKGYKDGEDYVVIAGHRRLAAGQYIKDTYKHNTVYPFITYPRGISQKELLLEHFFTNDGAELTPLQKAYGVAKLVEAKMTPKEIAGKLGFSEVYVGNLMKLFQAPAEAQDLVRKGIVSSTLLISELKKKGGDIMEFIERAKAKGNGIDIQEESKKAAEERLEAKRSKAKTGKKTKRKGTKAPKKTAKVTKKDVDQNSVKEAKRFVKLTEKDMPALNKGTEPVYQFLARMFKNNFSYQEILKYFVNENK